MTRLQDAERQMTAHGDTARESAVEHLDAAKLALKHGEDDNAEAHILDAIRQMGRASAFYDLASDMLRDAMEDDE